MSKSPPPRSSQKVHSFMQAQEQQNREARRRRVAEHLGLPLDHPEVQQRVEFGAIWDHPLAVINGEITAKWLRSIAALLDESDPRFGFVTTETKRHGPRGKRFSESESAYTSQASKDAIAKRAGAGQRVFLAKRYLLEAAEVMWPAKKRSRKT